ncbi:hypothetical protein EV715DRAFT_277249 [Schizophyllum commune]
MAPTLLAREEQQGTDKSAQAATIAIIVIIVVLVVATGVGLFVTREKRKVKEHVARTSEEYVKEDGRHYLRRKSYDPETGRPTRPVSGMASTRPASSITYAQVPLHEGEYEDPWTKDQTKGNVSVSEHDFTAVPLMHATHLPSIPSTVTLVSASPTKKKRDSSPPTLPPLHIPQPLLAGTRPLEADRRSSDSRPADREIDEDDIPTPSSSPSLYSQPSLYSRNSVKRHHRYDSEPPPPVPALPAEHRLQAASYIPREPSPLERGNTKKVAMLLKGRARGGEDPSRSDTMVSQIERQDSIMSAPTPPPDKQGFRFASGRPVNMDLMTSVSEEPESPRWNPYESPEDHHGRRGSLTDAFDSATSPTRTRPPSEYSASTAGLSRDASMHVASSFEPFVNSKRLSAIRDSPLDSPYGDDQHQPPTRIGDASADEHVAQKRWSARMKSVRAIVNE